MRVRRYSKQKQRAAGQHYAWSWGVAKLLEILKTESQRLSGKLEAIWRENYELPK